VRWDFHEAEEAPQLVPGGVGDPHTIHVEEDGADVVSVGSGRGCARCHP